MTSTRPGRAMREPMFHRFAPRTGAFAGEART